MFKLLILGPLPTKSDPLLTGGAIVLFNDLIDSLKNSEIEFIVIDTNKRNYINSFTAAISIVWNIVIKSFKVDHISIHSSRDYIYLGIVIILTAKIFNKKTSLRKFGGQTISTIENKFTRLDKMIVWLIKKFDYLFVETKSLLKHYSQIRDRTFWFPNVRKRVMDNYNERKFNKNFVFISHIIHEKGVGEILEASKNFDETYSFHLYGPLINNEFTESELSNSIVEYKGILKKEEVIPTLSNYNVLLLPSYKEGYPGIIIEAYSVGVPVIATNLSSICEICIDEVHGKLVTPKSVEELIAAIKFFNESNYSLMAKNCFAAFNQFESEPNSDKFLKSIQNKI